MSDLVRIQCDKLRTVGSVGADGVLHATGWRGGLPSPREHHTGERDHPKHEQLGPGVTSTEFEWGESYPVDVDIARIKVAEATLWCDHCGRDVLLNIDPLRRAVARARSLHRTEPVRVRHTAE